MKKEVKFSGLHGFRTLSFDPSEDSASDIAKLLGAGAPTARIERLQMRAQTYCTLPEVEQELDNILGLAKTRRTRELHFALLALERGFDLLDTQRHLSNLLRDQKRQEGTKKPRRKDINEWIEGQLVRQPDVKAPELWQRAPSWITDAVGVRRFASRVTECRKARK